MHQIWRSYRVRHIQALLIVLGIALGVGVVTAVSAFLDLGQRVEGLANASLMARELSIRPAAEVPEAFADPDQPLAIRLPEAALAPPEFSLVDLEQALESTASIAHGYAYSIRLFRDATSDQNLFFLQVTPGFIAASNFRLKAGSLLSADDFSVGRPSLLVTEETVRLLGLSGNPIGQVIRNLHPWPPDALTIVGVVEDDKRGGGGAGGYFPYPASADVTALYFAVDDTRLISQARAELQAFASRRWGESVVVTSPALDGHLTAERRRAAWLIAVFASSGLVVASLNIMNLMLANVYKRSREIAVRRALGATRSAIKRQILAEAGLLGLLGGGFGIAVGYGLLWSYNRYLEVATQGIELGLTLSPLAVGIALSASMGVIVLFGLYPAIVASKGNLVNALREI